RVSIDGDASGCEPGVARFNSVARFQHHHFEVKLRTIWDESGDLWRPGAPPAGPRRQRRRDPERQNMLFWVDHLAREAVVRCGSP
ncbi:MAG: hypothetical protein AAF269_08065, partial [Pseudomonadota bacterium]